MHDLQFPTRYEVCPLMTPVIRPQKLAHSSSYGLQRIVQYLDLQQVRHDRLPLLRTSYMRAVLHMSVWGRAIKASL